MQRHQAHVRLGQPVRSYRRLIWYAISVIMRCVWGGGWSKGGGNLAYGCCCCCCEGAPHGGCLGLTTAAACWTRHAANAAQPAELRRLLSSQSAAWPCQGHRGHVTQLRGDPALSLLASHGPKAHESLRSELPRGLACLPTTACVCATPGFMGRIRGMKGGRRCLAGAALPVDAGHRKEDHHVLQRPHLLWRHVSGKLGRDVARLCWRPHRPEHGGSPLLARHHAPVNPYGSLIGRHARQQDPARHGVLRRRSLK